MSLAEEEDLEEDENANSSMGGDVRCFTTVAAEGHSAADITKGTAAVSLFYVDANIGLSDTPTVWGADPRGLRTVLFTSDTFELFTFRHMLNIGSDPIF